MSKFNSPLSNVSVASPCPADWDSMYGDERKRFCGDCKLNVYNLSGMTREDAESLVMNAEGRLCVRFFRRADGTVLTRDCPVGFAKVMQRTRLIIAACLSMVMALLTGVLFASFFSRQRATMGDINLGVLAKPSPTPIPTMGAVAIRPTMGNVSVEKPQKKPNSSFEQGKVRVLDNERRGI